MDAKLRIAYIQGRVNRSPLWAIQPEALILALIPGLGEWEAAKPHTTGKGDNKVAVIPVEGVLTKDGPSWYGSNYQAITSAAERAAADPSVKHVVLAVDSPGGEVQGCPEAAAALAALAKVKPVSAMVDGTCASAAYWLASQASDVTITPSGQVGSVGVRMMHVDISKALDDAGFKVTELHSGDFKTEWSPYKPLTDEAVSDMQPRLDATHQDFLNAVAGGRGERATQDITDKRFGEGRMFSASAAVGHGLVDKVQAATDFYKAIMPKQEEASGAPSFPIGPRVEHERARLEAKRLAAKA